MILQTAAQVLALIFITVGVVYSVLSVVGMYRMPDAYTRMHAAAKVTAVSAALLLLAVALLSTWQVALRAIATLAFIYVTIPVATQVVARAAYNRREPMTERTIMDELRDRHDPDER